MLEKEIYRIVIPDDQGHVHPLPQLSWDREHVFRVAAWWRNKRHTAKCKKDCPDLHGVMVFKCTPSWDQVTVSNQDLEGLA